MNKLIENHKNMKKIWRKSPKMWWGLFARETRKTQIKKSWETWQEKERLRRERDT